MKRHYITAVIAIALEIIYFITEVIDGRFTDGIHHIIFILLFMLTIVAFKRPTIPFAIAIAAIGSNNNHRRKRFNLKKLQPKRN